MAAGSATTAIGAAAVIIALGALPLAGGCHVTQTNGPKGLLGLTWGEDATAAARRIGLAIPSWDAWIDPAFEAGVDMEHPRAVLGVEGLVRLVRAAGAGLEGVQVIYRACAADDARRRQLRDGLRRELHVKSPDVDVPYEVWADHSLVHLAADARDGTCTLTVAGPRFGQSFASALLREGVGDVGRSLSPR